MVDTGPQIAMSADGARLHLQHGPIDLIIELDGSPEAVSRAQKAAIDRFDGLLMGLVDELELLRGRVEVGSPVPTGGVARRMFDAVRPYATLGFVSPMAAVAGSVADEVGAAVDTAADLDRWHVNNGGDIAFGLKPGQTYTAGLVPDPRRATVESTAIIGPDSGVGGIATSGWHGRSLSLGIADAVTVFAPTAAAADAAATLIANRVDLGPHDQILRCPASDLDPDTDLGDALVTVDVGVLSSQDVARALAGGVAFAQDCVDRQLIVGAVLHLNNVHATVAGDRFPRLDVAARSVEIAS